ncbi:matrix Gla protein [Falco biarmicus]|uniref:matrix Gla protein n=1 Tax=Falco peregrinus TaxID=8954 RepID=UPI000386F923|nr:matrix Gla protein [Falco peregrinus]XP_005441377.1 matrix Gla protein [Falco cherrug]XP_037246323.1 matrix Gla protein [Falco rusticolus]XP_055568589.1 matrix Gla protein [Falco cherrug]XP_055663320.1 matrix Gla protein [Falco peregrinus]XP_056197751.1 matrix Gla protein [Falco biarmicus]XP_056197752.1 matrix Gla protein [Falco biarmicus]
MRTLIILMVLAILVMATTCYESRESMESHEYFRPFINRRSAYDFIQAHARLQAISQERIRERNKAPQELRREICEDYYPCDPASLHGYPSAYRHYLERRRTK